MAERVRMHVKKGDTVMVTTGKEKGKRGEVLRMYPKEINSRIIEGLSWYDPVHSVDSRSATNRFM